MIPKHALINTRSVGLYDDDDDYISGYSFLDKDRALLWKIGYTNEPQ